MLCNVILYSRTSKNNIHTFFTTAHFTHVNLFLLLWTFGKAFFLGGVANFKE